MVEACIDLPDLALTDFSKKVGEKSNYEDCAIIETMTLFIFIPCSEARYFGGRQLPLPPNHQSVASDSPRRLPLTAVLPGLHSWLEA